MTLPAKIVVIGASDLTGGSGGGDVHRENFLVFSEKRVNLSEYVADVRLFRHNHFSPHMFMIWKSRQAWMVRRVIISKDESSVRPLVMEFIGNTPHTLTPCFCQFFDNTQTGAIMEP